MPAVLMIEALTQVAAVLILEHANAPPTARVSLRGVNNAKFRRQVVPGDRLTLEVLARTAALDARKGAGDGVESVSTAWRRRSSCSPLSLAPRTSIRPRTCTRRRGSAKGRSIGANCTIGPEVTDRPAMPHRRVGRHRRLDRDRRRDAHLPDGVDRSRAAGPQMQGERTRLTIGKRNTIREFATINRGTAGGGGDTTIGDNNLLMAYVHVAHDCHVGSHTIFGPHATLGGHVSVEDYSNISAGSAVHQFCRVGKHGFVGGYSVVTKDALPFGRTIGGRPARIFGVNSIGLARRGFSTDTINQLKRAYRYLLQANTTHALAQIDADSDAVVAGSALPGGVHPQLAARRHPPPSDAHAPRSWSPTNEARAHRRATAVFRFSSSTPRAPRGTTSRLSPRRKKPFLN